MPHLDYIIEDIGGVWMAVNRLTGEQRPASSVEVSLWGELVRTKAPARESYIRVSEADLHHILNELEALRAEVERLSLPTILNVQNNTSELEPAPDSTLRNRSG